MQTQQKSILGKWSNRYSYWILALALLSFSLTLPFPYIGEEAVYTITSYEMWFSKHFLYPILHGINYGRPPLYNWLIIPIANLMGWPHMLVAARLVTALATIGTGLVLAYWAKRVFKESGFALFVLLVYLTGDALMYHGWIAYSDPLFGFFICTAIAALRLANLEERHGFVWLAGLAITAAFLTKALTAYVFYFLAFVLIAKQANASGKRAFILKPTNLLVQCLVIAFPLLWKISTSGANGASMLQDIVHKFSVPDLVLYFKQVAFFPLEILARFLPASGLLAYFFFRKRITTPEKEPDFMASLSWLILLSFIPYWLAPNTSSRYVLPLYPLIALWLARALWRVKEVDFNLCLKWFLAAVIIKYVLLGGLYYQQTHYRANYPSIAQQILAITKDKPLYTDHSGAVGLSVSAALDTQRFPAPPVTFLSQAKETDYFVISGEPNPSIGNIHTAFPLGKQKNKIYLLCKGQACNP